jgi:hypothetical protein
MWGGRYKWTRREKRDCVQYRRDEMEKGRALEHRSQQRVGRESGEERGRDKERDRERVRLLEIEIGLNRLVVELIFQ